MGLRALRVAAAVREQHGLEAVRKLYTVMGTRKHHDQADIGTCRAGVDPPHLWPADGSSPLLPMTRRGIR